MGKGLRVWSAFTKFIKSQCQDKQKAVDTQICGVFIPDQDNIQFMPLPSFLEAGKFKLQKKGADHLDISPTDFQQTSSILERYTQKYDQRMKVSTPTESNLCVFNYHNFVS